MNFRIIESRKSSVNEGKHYIMILMEKDDLVSALDYALKFAIKNSENKKYRIAFNGEGLRHSPYPHIHIILPKGNDQLFRLIENINF